LDCGIPRVRLPEVIDVLAHYYRHGMPENAQSYITFQSRMNLLELFGPRTHMAAIQRIVHEDFDGFAAFMGQLAETMGDRRSELVSHLDVLAENNHPAYRAVCLHAVTLYQRAIEALPLAQQDSAHAQGAGVLREILRTPAEQMIARTQSLITTHLGPLAEAGMVQPNAPYRVDTENVMRSTLITRTKRSILALDQLFPQRPPTSTMIDAIYSYLKNYPNDASDHERRIFTRVRGGQTEQFNAIRTLVGPTQHGDYSDAVVANTPYSLGPKDIGLADLTALIWHAINAYSPKQQSVAATLKETNLMRYHVFKALSQCIEDDGHRVCSVGYAQRITTALQGYYKEHVAIDEDYLLTQAPGPSTVLPQLFFTEVAQAFDRSLTEGQDPSASMMRAFFTATLQQAGEVYGEGAPQVEAVARMAREYLRVTYDFEMT
jgi:hypothetical protein